MSTPIEVSGNVAHRLAGRRTAPERAALALIVMTMLITLLVVVDHVRRSRPEVSTGGDGPDAIWELVEALSNMSGWLYTTLVLETVGLVQLMKHRQASAAVAGLWVSGPLTYAIAFTGTDEAFQVMGKSVGGDVALLVALLVAVIPTGITAAVAGRRMPRPRPVSVALGLGVSLFLLVFSAIQLIRGWLNYQYVASLCWYAPVRIDAAVGPWLSTEVNLNGSEHGLPFIGAGGVMLVAVFLLALLAVTASAFRIRGLFLAGAVGGPVALLIHHVAVWVVSNSALFGRGSQWMPLAILVLQSGILLAMSLAARSAVGTTVAPVTAGS
ncbi:hypothetical protein BW737_004705 [Actinomyces ruminis]|uniref:Uncharacterized protein n=2 Tax=Actinomyces ruminis TaxID=1937003 RepID=A0ABX4MCB3_9ACTO|nr:hypothetical protein BW737_004705 [Actinomyces ruminis]